MFEVRCPCCGEEFEVPEEEIMLEPFPHIICPECGAMMPMF